MEELVGYVDEARKRLEEDRSDSAVKNHKSTSFGN